MSHRLAPAEAWALVSGRHGDPFAVLGPHPASGPEGAAVVIRVFQPAAQDVRIVADEAGVAPVAMTRVHPAGLFEAVLPGRSVSSPYRFQVVGAEGVEVVDDPYRFSPTLSDFDLQLLGEGTHYEAYERLGAHLRTVQGVPGVVFVVWAPNARRVSVVGDWNGWDGRRHPMRLHPGSGLWELFVPGLAEGVRYKYELLGSDGALLPLKTDPYAFEFEAEEPRTASVVTALDGYAWGDDTWMAARAAGNPLDRPMAIYEVHLGSFMRGGPDGRQFLGYRELAERLGAYVSEMGFTHVELLPVGEHPFYASWGYQPLGAFAPTRRYGRPHDFMAFVDRLHQLGIGVLLDWVPAHFPEDPHGLVRFDGTCLYEHADPRQGRHPDWGTLVFNYGRHEVANYLIGNARFWLDRYHVDGLRVDAVASMLYLDYSRRAGEWVPNRYGGHENLEAIAFLRRFNEVVYGYHPGILTVAEESTAWPMVSRPTYLGGLGFGAKWNMGWMHDVLDYLARDPVHRKWWHDRLTFGLLYAWHENFVLPLSHDEVVHGKGSLHQKMPGDDWQRFANLRTLFVFMYAHPGKKLLFMGGEFGQTREWHHDRSLDWHLLDQGPYHRGLQRLVRDLNHLYRAEPALWSLDFDPAGFEWMDCHDAEQSVVAFLRRAGDGAAPVLVVVNFTPVPRHGYRVGVPAPGVWRERLNSDAGLYGGSNLGNAGGVEAEALAWGGQAWSLALTLPPLAALVLQPGSAC